VAKLTEWLMKHPKTNGLLVALMGVSFVGFLAIRLDDVLGFLPSAARRQEAIFRGILWAAGVSACFGFAAVLRLRWWSPSRIRRVVLGILVVVPLLGLLVTMPDRSGEPPGAGLCPTWDCVASALINWIAVGLSFVILGAIVVVRGSRESRAWGFLRGLAKPTGQPCSPVVTALPRRDEKPQEGWTFFFLCDCGFVGKARSSEQEAFEDAQRHAPGTGARIDVPDQARSRTMSA
jgi:hypothetical protein